MGGGGIQGDIKNQQTPAECIGKCLELRKRDEGKESAGHERESTGIRNGQSSLGAWSDK